MNIQRIVLQTIFSFVLFLMPTVALEPQDESLYTVSDFFVYYTQSTMMVHNPGCNIYSEQPLMTEAAKLFPPLKTHGWYLVGEPPISLIFLMPLFLIPAQFALWTFKVILLLCASLSLSLLVELFELNERQFQLSSIIMALSGPLWEATRVTKPGLIVLLAFTMCLWALKKNNPIAFALLFLPWTFKPQLLSMFLCELTGARKFKFIAFLAASTVALLLLTFPLFGMVNYQAWIDAINYGGAHPEIQAPFLHPTLRGQMMRFASIPDSVVKITSTIAFISAQVAGLFLGFKFSKSTNWLQLCVVCMPLAIVCTPYCHNYDLVLLIPSVIAFFKLKSLQALNKTVKIACIVVVSLCLLVFEMPIYTRIHYDFLQHPILTVSPLFCSLVVMSAIFVTMAYRDLKTATSDPGA